MNSKTKKLQGILPGIILSFAISFMIWVYAPLELCLTNPDDIWFRVSSLSIPISIFFFSCFLACSAAFIIVKLINGKLFNIALTVAFSLFISLYIQGNFLVKNLPGTEGQGIDWNMYPQERIKSILAFIIPLVAISILFIILCEKKLRKAVTLCSGFIASMLIITLGVLIVTAEKTSSDSVFATVKDEFVLSEDENIIVLILDSIENKTFKKELDNDPDLKEALNGFTYYDNALSGYSLTSRSVPNIFSGKWFENEKPYREYLTDSITNSPFFKKLKQDNFEIGYYTNLNLKLNTDQTNELFVNFDNAELNLKSKEVYRAYIKMAGMKYAPWDLKHYCWDAVEFSTSEAITKGSDNVFTWSNEPFYEKITNSTAELTDKKCARIIHLYGAHVPFGVDRNFNPKDDATYEDAVGLCGTIIKDYIKFLKSSGVYDNTSIVIMGDHGYAGNDSPEESEIMKRLNPAIMIKRAGDSHNLKISNAPISYIDLADAFVNLTDGKPVSELFEYSDDDERIRKFFISPYRMENILTEFEVAGQADAPDEYKKTGKLYEYKK